jgi:phospholipase/carboxylesterase
MFLLISNSLLLLTLIMISLKDIKKGLIPDIYLVIIALLGLMQLTTSHSVSVFILGGLGYALYKLYPRLKGKQGLGFGDVKMMAVGGIWLVPPQIPLFLILSGIGGVLTALLWKRLNKGPRFPLGPALAFALGICIVGNHGFSKGDTDMTMTYDGPILSPASGGKPDSLVVLIHGYGADGDDLLSLGNSWASLLPNTVFVAPHGPTECEMNPSGNQWFSLLDWDHFRISKDVQALTSSFNRYLDDLLQTYGLPPEKLALVGFSQGAILAIHMALHRPKCAGVVAYSGAFINDPTTLKVALPPMLLVHGLEDDVLPASASQAGEEALKFLGVPVELVLLPGLSHGIDQRGLARGGAFLKEHLGK